ncbi:Disease resistance protein RGA2 [Forsythia ovata]|uniref:Disease resistance protein RGA2 n=1 Tax=Forsythia ovata TaxID=205694 RepID=A0ABD1UYR6_9LAMI
MLGNLPLLKNLNLSSLTNVRSMGLSFYGASDCSSSSRNDGQETRLSFPSLQSLIIEEIPNLTEWAEAQTSGVQVFPCLEYLKIKNCHKLKTAPNHFPCLKELYIYDMDSDLPFSNIISTSNLTSLVQLSILASLKWLWITGCDELRELPDDLGSLKSLETLLISCCNLQLSPYPSGQKGFSSLRNLKICYCDKLSNLPSEMLESCTSLQKLEVYNCENLTSFPELSGMVWLNSLRELVIGGFSNPRYSRRHRTHKIHSEINITWSG